MSGKIICGLAAVVWGIKICSIGIELTRWSSVKIYNPVSRRSSEKIVTGNSCTKTKSVSCLSVRDWSQPPRHRRLHIKLRHPQFQNRSEVSEPGRGKLL